MASIYEKRATVHHWRWWSVALRGIAAIIFGILALAAPESAVFSLVILFGIYALADGVLALALGARTTVLPRSAIVIRGLISVGTGALLLLMPKVAGLTLVVLIGAWAIASGISEVAMAIRLRSHIAHEWLLGIEGALSVVFGLLLMLSPLAGTIVLGLWVGGYALVVGGMMIATAFRIRDLQHGLAELRAA